MNFRFEDKYLTDLGLRITIAEKLQDEILLGFNNVLYVNLKPYSVWCNWITDPILLSIEHESEMSLGFQIRVVKQ